MAVTRQRAEVSQTVFSDSVASFHELQSAADYHHPGYFNDYVQDLSYGQHVPVLVQSTAPQNHVVELPQRGTTMHAPFVGAQNENYSHHPFGGSSSAYPLEDHSAILPTESYTPFQSYDGVTADFGDCLTSRAQPHAQYYGQPFATPFAYGSLGTGCPSLYITPHNESSDGILQQSSTTTHGATSWSLNARHTVPAPWLMNRQPPFADPPVPSATAMTPPTPIFSMASPRSGNEVEVPGYRVHRPINPDDGTPTTLHFEEQQSEKLLSCDGQDLAPHIEAKIVKNLFLKDDAWTCYRRNYIAVDCHFTLGSVCAGRPVVVTIDNQQLPVSAMALTLTATVDESHGKAAEMVQFTPKRDKGPQYFMRMEKMMPKMRDGSETPYCGPILPLQHLASQPRRPEEKQNNTKQVQHVFDRLQFKQATANNGRRRATQEHYRMVVELHVDIRRSEHEEPDWIKVHTSTSEQLVVRGRSPSHYKEKNRTVQQGRSGSGPGDSEGSGNDDASGNVIVTTRAPSRGAAQALAERHSNAIASSCKAANIVAHTYALEAPDAISPPSVQLSATPCVTYTVPCEMPAQSSPLMTTGEQSSVDACYVDHNEEARLNESDISAINDHERYQYYPSIHNGIHAQQCAIAYVKDESNGETRHIRRFEGRGTSHGYYPFPAHPPKQTK